ncbi:MAG: hypothetical protein ACPGD5_03225 [Salibacteraceae bacterium]
MNIRKIFTLIAITALLFSCREQGKGWTVDALVPLVDSRIDLQNIFEDSIITPGKNGVLNLVYNTKAFDFKLQDYSTKDTILENKWSTPIEIQWNKRIPLVADTNKTNLDISDVGLTEAIIGSGSIKIDIESLIREEITISYVIPSAFKNGVPLKITRTLPASGGIGNPTLASETIKLDGYTINLQGQNKNEYNTFIYYLEVEFTNPTTPDTIYVYKPTDEILITQTVSEIKPIYGKGVFYTQSVSVDNNDDDTLDIFDPIIAGNLRLEEASLSLDLVNYIGSDIQGNISQVQSINTGSNDSISITGPILGKTINITRAGTNNNIGFPPVNPSYYSLVVNQNNSNINELIEILPDLFKYTVDFTINPQGNSSGSNDYFYTEHGIEGYLNVEIPMSITADNLTLVDTTEFTSDEEEELKNVIGGNINIHVENWYPFKTDIQITLLDIHGSELIDMFIENSEIAAAQVESDGQVKTPVKSILYAPVDQDKLTEYYKAEKAIIKLKFNTEGEDFKKIYSNYFCGVKLVGDINYNLVLD